MLDLEAPIRERAVSAASIAAGDALVDHKAYWAPVRSPGEAAYLVAVINSAAVLAKVTDLGGSIVVPAEDTPYGRLAQAADPTGANFRIIARP